MFTDETVTCPQFGQRITKDGQPLILLVENPHQEGSWHALNTSTGTIHLVTPTDIPEGSERLEPAALALEVVQVLKSLQDRLDAAELLNTRSASKFHAIRDYAVLAHERGDICEVGLRDFLSEFNLAPFPTEFTVHVNVYATATITAPDSDTAVSRIRYLVDGVQYSGDTDEDDVSFHLGSVEVEHADN